MYCLNLATGVYKPNKYHETVKILQALMSLTSAKVQWVKGHSGDAFNEKVDELAKLGRDKHTVGGAAPKKKRRSRRREIRRAKRRAVKEWKRRTYGYARSAQ
jgi:ribonuclease HI